VQDSTSPPQLICLQSNVADRLRLICDSLLCSYNAELLLPLTAVNKGWHSDSLGGL
jgi:hypothetical protein